MGCPNFLPLWFLLIVPLADGPRIVHHQHSSYSDIYVVDQGDRRYLRFGGPEADDQSVVSLRDPDALPMDYLRLAALGLAVPAKVDRMLMIGLGAGAFTTWAFRKFQGLQIEVVEIDPVVVTIARRYFRLPDDPRYRVHVADGARFMQKETRRFDLIFIDAYDAQDIPLHLTTPAFFERVRFRLQPEGVAVLNLSVSAPIERNVAQVFGRVFPVVHALRTADGNNLLLYGRGYARPISLVDWRRRAERLLGEWGKAVTRMSPQGATLFR